MSVSLESIRSVVTRHRFRTEVIGVSLLALTVFVVLGARARGALVPARAGLEQLRAASSEVETFRAAFRASPEHDVRLAEVVDSLGVAIAREDRLRAAQRIVLAAERLGLRDVNVRIASPVSAAAPVGPSLIRTTVALADYTLALSTSGDFASVLSLINQLPASVALQRIAVVRESAATRYDVILAVFETSPTESRDGPRG